MGKKTHREMGKKNGKIRGKNKLNVIFFINSEKTISRREIGCKKGILSPLFYKRKQNKQRNLKIKKRLRSCENKRVTQFLQ